MNQRIEEIYCHATKHEPLTRESLRTLAMMERAVERLLLASPRADADLMTRRVIMMVITSTRRNALLARLLRLTDKPVGAERELESLFSEKEKIR